MADLGKGIAFAFDSYFGSIQSLSWSGLSRAAVDVTTFATTGGKDYLAGDLYDAGELQATILFAPATSPHLIDVDAAATGTVTWSDSGATTWAATAHITGMTINAGGVDERVTADVTLKFSGDITIT